MTNEAKALVCGLGALITLAIFIVGHIRYGSGRAAHAVTPADEIIADLTYRLGLARAALSPFARAGRDPFFANADRLASFKTDALVVAHLITAAGVYRETGLKDRIDDDLCAAAERLLDECNLHGVDGSLAFLSALNGVLYAVRARRNRHELLGIKESTL